MASNEQLELVPASQVKEPEPPPPAAPQADKDAASAPANRRGDASADPGDGSAADPDGEGQQPKPKRRDHRIEEYYRLRDENTRNQEIIRRMAERGLDPQGQPAKPAQTGDWKSQGRAPREEDFPGNYEAYLEAKVEHRLDTKLTERDQRVQAAQRERQQRQQQEQFRERMDIGREKYPDFEDVALSDAVQISEPMALAIGDSDMAADIAYWLGKNPKEAERIAALSPLAAAREIGKIEDKIAAAPATGKPVTNAPKPVRTVGNGAKAGPDLEHESIEEFMRRENEKDMTRILSRSLMRPR